jgi:hypothetical protein
MHIIYSPPWLKGWRSQACTSQFTAKKSRANINSVVFGPSVSEMRKTFELEEDKREQM